MNDTQKALNFSTQVDDLLENRSTSENSSENADLLTVAQTLAITDFSHESRIKQSLYARLRANRAHSTRSHYWQRRLVTATFSIVVLMAVVFTVPPLRALAQEVIKRLQTLTLTNDPSLFEPHLNKPVPTFDPANPPIQLLTISLEQVIAKAGFTPLLPTYLPAGYSLTTQDASINQIRLEFQPADRNPSDCCAVLGLSQSRSRPSDSAPFPVGDVPIEDVTVRGVAGLWVQNSHTGMTPDENGDLQIMPTSILTWEADGYLFWMSSYDSQTNLPLSQAEMMKVANGLQLPKN